MYKHRILFYHREANLNREVLRFNHPFKKNGDPRVYTSILLYLHEHGSASKREILINGLGRTEPLYATGWYKEHSEFHPAPFDECGVNGYLSSMFSDLHAAGLIYYNTYNQKWYLGNRYEEWKTWLRSGEGL